MTAPTPTVLLIDADDATRARLEAAGVVCASSSEGSQAGQAGRYQAAIYGAATRADLAALCASQDLRQTAFDTAVVVRAAVVDLDLEAELLGHGVEAIVAAADEAGLARAIRHAVARKRLERSVRTAYATDLTTGLPHQAQLVEHMTQLLALRERQPAPMVLIVLRIEGYADIAARLGDEAANVLRRKVAVRLRSGLRASDVVAALSPDAFGVLLGHLEARGDGERVADKLARALQLPIPLAGQACTVSASIGIALYPEHGKDAETLLRRASAQAGSQAFLGSEGGTRPAERGPAAAANDETR